MRRLAAVLLLLLLCATPAFAVGLVTRYVDPDSAGGNGTTSALTGANAAYASCSAWEAAEDDNLVTADVVHRVYFLSQHASHTADTTTCAISGWTTDATRYIDMVVDPSYRHSGVYSTTKYRMEMTNPAAGQILQIQEEYVNVTGFQVKLTSDNTSAYKTVTIDSVSTSVVRLDKCLIVGVLGSNTSSTNTSGLQISDTQTTVYVTNSLIAGYLNGRATPVGRGVYVIDVANAYFYNNTWVNNTTGLFRNTSGTVQITNGGFSGNTTAYTGTGVTCTTCSTTTPTFKNAGGSPPDYHLATGDTTWTGAGASATDLSASFTDDVDGKTRFLPWTLGFDQQDAVSFLSLLILMLP
jgi:hypothetical protein